MSHQSNNLYMTGVLESETRHNLDTPLAGLLASATGARTVLTINDKGLPGPARVWLRLDNGENGGDGTDDQHMVDSQT